MTRAPRSRPRRGRRAARRRRAATRPRARAGRRPPGAARAACPRASSRRATATSLRSSSGTPTRSCRRSSPPSSGSGARRRARGPTCSMKPTARSTAPGGSSSRPEREREEEEDLRVGRAFDRRIELGIDREHELALHAMEVADEPVVHPEPAAVAERDGSSSAAPAIPTRRGCARTRAPTRDALRGRAGSGRSTPARSLWNVPGVSWAPYQPTPKPSPFVVSAPIVEWRLWSMSECFGL